MSRRISRVPGFENAENFFRCVIPYFKSGGGHNANTVFNSNGVPGRADTKAIDNSLGETVDHLLWRQDNNPHFGIRINAASDQPFSEQQCVAGERVHGGKGQSGIRVFI